MTTPGWELVAPQKARHVDGYEVFSDGRFQEGYRDARGKAVVAVERTFGLSYLDPQVFWWLPTGELVAVDESEREQILERIQAGMTVMGTQSQISAE